MNNYHLTIVSIDRQIFDGVVRKVHISGIEGEMGIFSGHSPLLTLIKPSIVCITKLCDTLEYIYISGGILEVQKKMVIILADSVIKSAELDEEEVRKSKIRLEKIISNLSYSNKEYSKIILEMSKISAKLRLINLSKDNYYL